jgi:hypothetical protein
MSPNFEFHTRASLSRLARRMALEARFFRNAAFRQLSLSFFSRGYLSRQFQQPDYLVSPDQVTSAYLPVGVPKGTQCLLLRIHDRALLFSKLGDVLLRFSSPPGPSFCFHCIQTPGCLYVIDVLQFEAQVTYQWMARDRFALLDAILPAGGTEFNGIRLENLHRADCNYSSVWLFHEESTYTFGVNSSVFKYKPQNCRRNEVDLYISKSGQAFTKDGLCLTDLDMEEWGITKGDVVRFGFDRVVSDDPPRLAGMRVEGIVKKGEETWSKVMWRNGESVKYEEVAEALRARKRNDKKGSSGLWRNIAYIGVHKKIKIMLENLFSIR